MNTQEINEYVEQLENEVKDIQFHALQLSWLMRGGATYSDVMYMSYNERTMITRLSNDNLETTKKSGLPYF